MTPDPLKVIDAIQAVMAERLAWANAPGDSVHQKAYESAGYQTAWLYCEATDRDYWVCKTLLLAGGYEV